MRLHLFLSVGALLSCGHRGESFSSGDSSTATVGAQTVQTCSSTPYTLDGLFTNFPRYVDPTVTSTTVQPPASYEWSNVRPLVGMYTYMYTDTCAADGGNYLYFLNDWHLNRVAPIMDRCFNRFDFFNAATHDAIEVRVYGNQTVTVLKNGVDASASAQGGAGFASSPNVAAPHSIFEFRLFFPWNGAYTNSETTYVMSAGDPCGGPPPPPPPPQNPPPTVGTECDDPGYLIDEPVTAHVTFNSSGGMNVQKGLDVPMFLGLDKFEVAAGDQVVARGRRFGKQPGSVSVDGIQTTILIWTDSRVLFVVPKGMTAGQTVISGDGWSVAGPVLRSPSTSPVN